MILAGVGKSNNQDSLKAGVEACREAMNQLKKEADLVFIFASVIYNQKKIIEGARLIFPKTTLVGCSSSGAIVNKGPLLKQVVAMALSTPELHWTIGVGKDVIRDSFVAAKIAAQEVKSKAKELPSLLILLLDGFAENGTAVIKGIQEVFGKNFPIIGGSAGDDFLFKKTFQYLNQEVFSGAIIEIGVSGKFVFGVGSGHGWEPVGPPLKVTKAYGRKLIEINHQPALNVFEDYFGTKAHDLIQKSFSRIAYSYPLGIELEGKSELLLRNILKADEKGEITCLGEIPEGVEIRLMLGERERAIEAAKEAAENVLFQLKGVKPKIGFIFDGIGRSKLLGPKAKEEIDAIEGILGKEVPLIGFYSYGEQSPLLGVLGQNCFSVFQNATITLLAFGEKA